MKAGPKKPAAVGQGGSGVNSVLSAAEVQRCHDVFQALDRGTGELPLRHLRSALQRLGLFLAEDDLFYLISEYDPDGTGTLSLNQFLSLVGRHRHRSQASAPMDSSALDAFVALGGNKDQSGVIATDKLRHVVSEELGLPINIDKLISEADADGSGFIDFEEFTNMLKDPGRPPPIVLHSLPSSALHRKR
jgi:Ca2+-binding EF-hand superfamily protein